MWSIKVFVQYSMMENRSKRTKIYKQMSHTVKIIIITATKENKKESIKDKIKQ